MEPVAKLSKKIRVMINDVDFTEKLKISAAFNYFQEIAGVHSSNLGIGLKTIERKYGVFWVLTRMRVDIVRYPLWNEEIIIETWPQKPQKFKFERDFLLKDLDGRVIIRAVSIWVLLDVQGRNLRKTDAITGNYPDFITERAIDCTLGKIVTPNEQDLVYERVIGCSDIDINRHLNNSKYIDFIIDCFSMDELEKYQVKSIQANYSHEAFPGDCISLYKSADPQIRNRIYVEGVGKQNNKAYITARIDIEEN